jgi:hypothetical protein
MQAEPINEGVAAVEGPDYVLVKVVGLEQERVDKGGFGHIAGLSPASRFVKTPYPTAVAPSTVKF